MSKSLTTRPANRRVNELTDGGATVGVVAVVRPPETAELEEDVSNVGERVLPASRLLHHFLQPQRNYDAAPTGARMYVLTAALSTRRDVARPRYYTALCMAYGTVDSAALESLSNYASVEVVFSAPAWELIRPHVDEPITDPSEWDLGGQPFSESTIYAPMD